MVGGVRRSANNSNRRCHYRMAGIPRLIALNMVAVLFERTNQGHNIAQQLHVPVFSNGYNIEFPKLPNEGRVVHNSRHKHPVCHTTYMLSTP